MKLKMLVAGAVAAALAAPAAAETLKVKGEKKFVRLGGFNHYVASSRLPVGARAVKRISGEFSLGLHKGASSLVLFSVFLTPECPAAGESFTTYSEYFPVVNGIPLQMILRQPKAGQAEVPFDFTLPQPLPASGCLSVSMYGGPPKGTADYTVAADVSFELQKPSAGPEPLYIGAGGECYTRGKKVCSWAYESPFTGELSAIYGNFSNIKMKISPMDRVSEMTTINNFYLIPKEIGGCEKLKDRKSGFGRLVERNGGWWHNSAHLNSLLLRMGAEHIARIKVRTKGGVAQPAVFMDKSTPGFKGMRVESGDCLISTARALNMRDWGFNDLGFESQVKFYISRP